MKQAKSDQLGVILLKGGGPFHIYSTDMEGIFRQEVVTSLQLRPSL